MNVWKIYEEQLNELTKDVDDATILIDVLHKNANERKTHFCGAPSACFLF